MKIVGNFNYNKVVTNLAIAGALGLVLFLSIPSTKRIVPIKPHPPILGKPVMTHENEELRRVVYRRDENGLQEMSIYGPTLLSEDGSRYFHNANYFTDTNGDGLVDVITDCVLSFGGLALPKVREIPITNLRPSKATSPDLKNFLKADAELNRFYEKNK